MRKRSRNRQVASTEDAAAAAVTKQIHRVLREHGCYGGGARPITVPVVPAPALPVDAIKPAAAALPPVPETRRPVLPQPYPPIRRWTEAELARGRPQAKERRDWWATLSQALVGLLCLGAGVYVLDLAVEGFLSFVKWLFP
jgi:hypothetical protein